MKKTVPVVGMACASCSANVENKLRSLPGVNDVSVSLIGRSAMIDYDESKISLEAMKKEINSIGYNLVIVGRLRQSGSKNIPCLSARRYCRYSYRLQAWLLACVGLI